MAEYEVLVDGDWRGCRILTEAEVVARGLDAASADPTENEAWVRVLVPALDRTFLVRHGDPRLRPVSSDATLFVCAKCPGAEPPPGWPVSHGLCPLHAAELAGVTVERRLNRHGNPYVVLTTEGDVAGDRLAPDGVVGVPSDAEAVSWALEGIGATPADLDRRPAVVIDGRELPLDWWCWDALRSELHARHETGSADADWTERHEASGTGQRRARRGELPRDLWSYDGLEVRRG